MYKKYKQFLNVVNGKSFEVIRERKEKLRRESEDNYTEEMVDQDDIPKKRKAFLDLLLEANELSDEELKQEVNTFMAAGHETTSTTVKWCLFLLANNPDIQARVHEELDDILQTNDDTVTKEEIRQMKYLECCIKESMRIYPSVEQVGRSLTGDLNINGHTIPSGAIVVINMWVLHRDEKYFPDAEVFDPDRFLPENAVGRHPYAYVPFSAGPRNCIGQKFGMLETKVLLSMILRRFSVSSLLKPEDINFTRNITLKSVETILLKFYPRA